MKINLKKLANLEKKYSKSVLATETIHCMVNVILETRPMSDSVRTDANYVLSVSTLEELGVIKNEKKD